MSLCQLDDAAEAAFQQELAKNFVTLRALLDFKKTFYSSKCPSQSKACKDLLSLMFFYMSMNATVLMQTYPAGGNPFNTMKEIAKTWDSILETEIQKYTQQFPSPSNK